MAKIFLSVASASGLTAVVAGAFASHVLREKLGVTQFSAWQTAVQYQFYHALALLVVALLLQQKGLVIGLLHGSGIAFTAGLLLFCGSLYTLALGGPSWVGPITPLGGLCFILGWLLLLISALRGNF